MIRFPTDGTHIGIGLNERLPTLITDAHMPTRHKQRIGVIRQTNRTLFHIITVCLAVHRTVDGIHWEAEAAALSRNIILRRVSGGFVWAVFDCPIGRCRSCRWIIGCRVARLWGWGGFGWSRWGRGWGPLLLSASRGCWRCQAATPHISPWKTPKTSPTNWSADVIPLWHSQPPTPSKDISPSPWTPVSYLGISHSPPLTWSPMWLLLVLWYWCQRASWAFHCDREENVQGGVGFVIGGCRWMGRLGRRRRGWVKVQRDSAGASCSG